MPKLAGMVIARAGVAHGMEDAHHAAFADGVFAIADGVSRPDYDERGAVESARVRAAAGMFCDTAVGQLARAAPNALCDCLAQIAASVTEQMKRFNEGFGFSFPYRFDGDPYAAVGVAARIGSDRVLHFGFIGDVGLAVLTSAGDLDLLTLDQLVPMRRYLETRSYQTENERRAIIRKELRNNLETLDAAHQRYGYGVLNGDERALRFWQVGSRKLNAGDVILAYTDGAVNLVENRAFKAWARKHVDKGDWDAAKADVMALLRSLEAEQPEKFEDDLSLIMAKLEPADGSV